MKHLELCQKYFETYGKPMLSEKFPDLKYAAGLVGEGSGCLGFDDYFSTDHDFAPGFCLWLTDEDFALYGEKLQHEYEALPCEFMGFGRENILDNTRMGVMRIGDFYESFTGCSDVPKTNMEWFLISENNLCSVTNGMVFEDKLGEFSRIREGFRDFYPKDVWLKKLAARVAVIAQAGQYNYNRCMQRNDSVAASLALAKFAEAVISIIYLLCKRPMPFYKWSYRGLIELPQNHNIRDISAELEKCFPREYSDDIAISIENICVDLLHILMEKGLVEFNGHFLQDYISQIMDQIGDGELRSMHPMADCF